jgi:hypothetical protein
MARGVVSRFRGAPRPEQRVREAVTWPSDNVRWQNRGEPAATLNGVDKRMMAQTKSKGEGGLLYPSSWRGRWDVSSVLLHTLAAPGDRAGHA